MSVYKQAWRDVSDRIDGLSVRERALIFGAAMLALVIVAINFVFVPMHKQQVQLQQEFNEKAKQVHFFDQQIKLMIEQSGRDPDQDNAQKLAALKRRLETIDASLAEFTTGLVTPREMARLVEEVLVKNRKLKIVKLESLPPAPVVEPDDGSEPQPPSTGYARDVPEQLIYKHGILVEVEGQYLEILAYLKALEAMEWKVFWGRVTLDSERYPVSTLVLVVYTLSLHEGWIGV